MDLVIAGFGLVLEPFNLVLMVAGLAIGIAIGATPGLNVPLAVALALPFTYGLPPLAGISMLLGIYKGGTYGGSIPAILLNVPGTPAAAASAMDGHALARRGKAGKALRLAIDASVLGEIVSDLALILLAAQIAHVALAFGPPEFFALSLFALTIIGLVAGRSLARGLAAGALGVLLATVGLDPVEATPRLAFGHAELSGGLEFIALIIGAFAISEVLTQAERGATERLAGAVLTRSSDPADGTISRREIAALLPTILRGSAIGVAIGAIPGIGSAIAAFLSYGLAKRLSGGEESFGEGSLKGLAAAESANNAVTGSTLIPLLTLGIPGDVVTAIMLGALTVHGLQPGPTLFAEQGDLMGALLAGMLVVSLLHYVVARLGLPLFVRAARLPRDVLFPLVGVLCVAGTLASTSGLFDVFVMLGFGLVGYLMTRAGVPIAPMLIGFILGPIIELSLRQSLLLSGGDPAIFVTRPIAAAFLGLALVSVAGTAWGTRRRAEGAGS